MDDFNPNYRNGDGQTIIHIFAYEGKDKLIRPMTLLGADPNAADNSGMTPLHYAAWQGHAVAIQELLCGGADPTKLTHCGQSIADMARHGGHLDLAYRLDELSSLGRPSQAKAHLSPSM